MVRRTHERILRPSWGVEKKTAVVTLYNHWSGKLLYLNNWMVSTIRRDPFFTDPWLWEEGYLKDEQIILIQYILPRFGAAPAVFDHHVWVKELHGAFQSDVVYIEWNMPSELGLLMATLLKSQLILASHCTTLSCCAKRICWIYEFICLLIV